MNILKLGQHRELELNSIKPILPNGTHKIYQNEVHLLQTETERMIFIKKEL